MPKFTSCSLRHAAWAGWYSALGDKENAEKFIHYAYAEWGKEVAAGRRFGLLTDLAMKYLTDKYLKDINKEIKKPRNNSFLENKHVATSYLVKTAPKENRASTKMFSATYILILKYSIYQPHHRLHQ